MVYKLFAGINIRYLGVYNARLKAIGDRKTKV